MATEAQIAANRLNALKSTGPNTEAGLAVSSQNAFIHGLTATLDSFNPSEAKLQMLPHEDVGEYKKLLFGFIADFQPASTIEQTLVRHMAEYAWLRSRAIYYQTSCFNHESEHMHEINRHPFSLYMRYETQNHRGFNKALRELQNIRALRAREEAAQAAQDRQKQLDDDAAKRAEVKDKRALEIDARQKERHYIALATEYLRDEPASSEVRGARQNR